MKRALAILFFWTFCLQSRGQLFTVNGHRLFLDCQGKVGGVTVLLIAGGGGTTGTWDKVEQPISDFAHVCSYDRLGLGRSDPLPKGQEQSVRAVVSDLAGLMRAAKIRAPYILVGHSIGGLYARAYDTQHDKQVAGTVLVDSSHEEQIWRFAQSEPQALSKYPRWRDRKFMRSEGFLPPGERLRWTFGKPLVVIEHGIPPEPVWHAMQLDLASRSPQSNFVTATNSSHYIQKLQPQLVIEAIRDVFRDCQKTDFR